MTQRFAVIGIDHRHVYELTQYLIDAGLECAGWWNVTTNPHVLEGFRRRFPHLPEVAERERLMDDQGIGLVVTAAIPSERAALAIEAMRRGKDVLADKPGITTRADLAAVQAAVAETRRKFTVAFGDRWASPASARARELVQAGAIGRLVSTTGMSPHRMNRQTRPDWFWDARTNGSILVDIGCHQIDSFLHLTGREEAEIVHAAIRSVAPERTPVADFQDWGEMILRNDVCTATMQMHWFTPDGLADWGDGRAFIWGTEGFIELRKNLDLLGRDGGQHLFLTNNAKTEYIACAGQKVGTFRAFAADLRDRTETAMTQSHCFAVCRLALEAEERALAG
ncbi:MAG: Gfo/Idh/MocA family oxidoreductase [Acetobacteraceae bacterium]|nr:Gfo/Idh/MocA family oxidoreductase [Acetobacteraceae bacterium]